MLRFLLISIVCFGFIYCEWKDVEHPKGLLGPIIKTDTSSKKVCFPDSSKWVKVKYRINVGIPNSLRLGIRKEYKAVYGRIVESMKKKNINRVFTYTIEEKMDSAKNKYFSLFFKIFDNENIELDLSCSTDKNRNCAVIVNQPPSCFKSLDGKGEMMGTTYSFSLEDKPVKKYQVIDAKQCGC